MRRQALLLGFLLLAGALGAANAQDEPAPDAGAADAPQCDPAAAPGPVQSAKAILVDKSTVDVAWTPPATDGCFDSFTVSAPGLPSKKVNDSLRVTFTGLKAGATYKFSVVTNGPTAKSGAAAASVALPPSFLSVRPDAPENLTAVALSDSSAQLAWSVPAGNPKVDSYQITAVLVNATGFPIKGGKNLTFTAPGTATTYKATGLTPGAYYVFEATSKSTLGKSPQPAIAFRNMPGKGELPPLAPVDLQAGDAGQGSVALEWQPPATGAAPDYYEIEITEVDASGKPISATNTIPYVNTSAVIRDLTPGATYQFAVQSFSTAYETGKTASITYTVPKTYVAPRQAPSSAPGDLNADVYYNEVVLTWTPAGGSSYYIVSAYDAYSGRNLGIQYKTNQNSISISGLPAGQPVELVVQGVAGGDYYSAPASITVELAQPVNNYYGYYSPYGGYGYNPYLPYWYSSYYPTGYYNYWYPGKWAGYGIYSVLHPFNNYWGPNWWYTRPIVNPLNPLNPLRPNYWGASTVGWARSATRSRGQTVTTLPARLPGQRPITTTRPAPLPDVIRPTLPGGAGGLPGLPGVTRPGAAKPGGLPSTLPSTLPGGVGSLVPGGGATTRPATKPAPGLVDAGGGAIGGLPGVTTPILRPAPGSVTGGGGLPGTGGLPGVTTLPGVSTGLPGGLPGTTRPTTGISTLPTMPSGPSLSGGRPTTTMPMTRPAPTMPMTRPAPTMPMTRPAPMTPMPMMPTAGGFGGGGGGFGGGGLGGGGGGRFGRRLFGLF